MTTTYEPNLVLSTEEYDVVGTAPSATRRAGQGDREGEVQRGHPPARHASRQTAPQSARPTRG